MLNSSHLSSSSTSTRASVTTERGKKTACEICNEKFNVLHREHCCKRCVRSVCSSCSKSKKKIIGYGGSKPDKEHRICTVCKKESDHLEFMVKENNMKFGSDSIFSISWTDSLGLSNKVSEVERNFSRMKIASQTLTDSQAYQFLAMSISMQSYIKNFDGNYSFTEMLYYTQNECTTPPEDIIMDTITAFLSVHHERVGFSDELLNLSVFLLCFCSPAKVVCLLQRIYAGDIIPEQLFPKTDGDHLNVHKSKHRMQCQAQILKVLKERYKCDVNQLTQMQKFLEETGMRIVESLMVGFLNFETCFSIFDSIVMTQSPSKYTQIIRCVVSLIYLNRDSIAKKSSDLGLDLAKDLLDRTYKEDLMLAIKWNIPDIPIPIVEDKLKDLQVAYATLQRKTDDLSAQLTEANVINEQLKNESKQKAEDYSRQNEQKKRQLEQMESENGQLKGREQSLSEQLKASQEQVYKLKSEATQLEAKNSSLESDKSLLDIRIKGLSSELSVVQQKHTDSVLLLSTGKESATRYQEESKKLAASYTQLEAELSLSRSRFAKEIETIKEDSIRLDKLLKQEKAASLAKAQEGETKMAMLKVEYEDRIVNITSEFEVKLKQQNDTMKRELQDKTDSLNGLTTKFDQAQKQLSSVNDQFTTIKSQLVATEEQLNQEQQKNGKVSEQVIALEAKIAGLNSAMALEKENQKEIMSALKTEHQKNVAGVQESKNADKIAFEATISSLQNSLQKEKETVQSKVVELAAKSEEIHQLEISLEKEKVLGQESSVNYEEKIKQEKLVQEQQAAAFREELQVKSDEIAQLKQSRETLELELEQQSAMNEGYRAQIKVIEEQQAIHSEEAKLNVSEETGSAEHSERVQRMTARIEVLEKEVQAASDFRATANANASNSLKKYKKLEDDSSAEIAGLKQSLKAGEDAKGALQSKITQMLADIASLKGELSQGALKLKSVEGERDELHEKNLKINGVKDQLDNQCEDLKKEVALLKGECNESNKNIADLSAKLSKFDDEIQEKEAKWNLEKSSLQNAVDVAEKKYKAADDENKVAVQKINELNEECKKSTSRIAELDAQVEKANARCETLQAQCDEEIKNNSLLKGASESANQRAQAEIERITMQHGKANLLSSQANEKLTAENNTLVQKLSAVEKKMQEQQMQSEAVIAQRIAEFTSENAKSEFERKSVLEEATLLRVQNEKYLIRIVEGENKLEEMQAKVIDVDTMTSGLREKNEKLQAILDKRTEQVIELQNELEMRELQSENAEVVELRSKLAAMTDLQETIKMKNAENMSLQTMIRSMSVHQKGESEVGNSVVVRRLKEENELLIKERQSTILRQRRIAITVLVKMMMIGRLKQQLIKLAEMNSEVIEVENRRSASIVMNEGLQLKTEKEQMLMANLEKSQKQIMVLTEENSEQIVRMKRAEGLLSSTTTQLKAALSKIFLMSLECERLGDLCKEAGL